MKIWTAWSTDCRSGDQHVLVDGPSTSRVASFNPGPELNYFRIADKPRTGLVTGSPLIPNGLPVTFDRVETLIPPIDLEFQGLGYATETLQAMLDYLLLSLGKDRVFGSVDPRNVRSMRLLQRVGMRKQAHRVKGLWFKGEWVDDAIFAITASEWKSRNIGNSMSS